MSTKILALVKLSRHLKGVFDTNALCGHGTLVLVASYVCYCVNMAAV